MSPFAQTGKRVTVCPRQRAGRLQAPLPCESLLADNPHTLHHRSSPATRQHGDTRNDGGGSRPEAPRGRLASNLYHDDARRPAANRTYRRQRRRQVAALTAKMSLQLFRVIHRIRFNMPPPTSN